MREFKFRAWNKVANFMIYWDEFTDYEQDQMAIVGKDYRVFNDSEFILLQSTGLKDSKGNEIYEGDILEAEHKLKTQKFKRRYQVIFNEKGYWDAISLDGKPVRLCYAGFDKCEVIGNIYESPELLGAIENAK